MQLRPEAVFQFSFGPTNTRETSLPVPKGFLSQAPHDQKMWTVELFSNKFGELTTATAV